ncbi:MAG TPA: ABC transporter ATP-binding protein [Acidimicrobiia bacterium]|nr:ABC transporter ATP-binding protein [Acidimicrobiia bacterium]
MSLLEVEGVGKRFGGVVALDGVSMSMNEGEILGLVGPNGSGKSTLINILSGFYPADSGTLRFRGEDITASPAHRIASIGVARTYQIPRPFDTMTPRENIAVSYMFGQSRHTLVEAQRSAQEWLEFTGLADVADTGIGELTLHQLKFLELARALATQPSLLLLDEVLAGLNPSEINASIEMIRRIHERGITILIVEHVVRVVMALSDRLVVLNQGQVISEGVPEQVMTDPAVVAAYLGEKRPGA